MEGYLHKVALENQKNTQKRDSVVKAKKAIIKTVKSKIK
jgi:hypothetical protein|tara:strand:+ start:109709 stop:109825 length:117 start_codon:yes stop_codon:yes gene_type:complete